MRKIHCTLVAFILFVCVVSNAQDISVRKLPFSTKEYSEIAPVVKDSLLLFSSDKNIRFAVKAYDQNKANFYNLFQVDQLEDSSWTKVEQYLPGYFSMFHTSSVAFSADKEEMIFTEAQYKDKKRAVRAEENLNGIYLAQKRGDKYARGKSLPINSRRDYNTGHPTMSSDGRFLFFVSDKEGGYGGSDIYMSERVDEEWGEAVNLGEVINTQGSELYPYFHPSGRLYFTSSGHVGQGGMDIFYTMQTADGWMKPVNLAAPINSPADDFSCYIRQNGQAGYFASNREGNDDLFEFNLLYPSFDNPQKQEIDSYKYRFYDKTGGKGDGPLKYLWYFGDGTKAEGDTVIHEYTKPGEYLVKSVLVDTLENMELFVLNEYFQEVKPKKQIFITALDTVKIGENVIFDAIKSNFEDFNPKDFFWEFPGKIRAKGETITHVFRKKGRYKVFCGCVSKDDPNEKMCSYKEIIVRE